MSATKIINKINQKLLNIPFCCLHYYPVQEESKIDLRFPESWNLARKSIDHFTLPDSRDEWLRITENGGKHDSLQCDNLQRADQIIDIIRENNFKNLISLGVGMASLEYLISKKLPNINLFLSDYSEENVAWLNQVAGFLDNSFIFDLKKDIPEEKFPIKQDNSLVLIHRVDPHLSDAEWRDVFYRLKDYEYILFVPHRILDFKYLWESKKNQLLCKISGNPMALSGYVRTNKSIFNLWKNIYSIKEIHNIGYTKGFLLQKIC